MYDDKKIKIFHSFFFTTLENFPTPLAYSRLQEIPMLADHPKELHSVSSEIALFMLTQHSLIYTHPKKAPFSS